MLRVNNFFPEFPFFTYCLQFSGLYILNRSKTRIFVNIYYLYSYSIIIYMNISNYIIIKLYKTLSIFEPENVKYEEKINYMILEKVSVMTFIH